MFVVTGRVGAANSEGVQCSGLSSIAKRFIQCVIQQIGIFRSHGAKPDCSGRGLQTLRPYGIPVQLNSLRTKTRILRFATQRQHGELKLGRYPAVSPRSGLTKTH